MNCKVRISFLLSFLLILGITFYTTDSKAWMATGMFWDNSLHLLVGNYKAQGSNNGAGTVARFNYPTGVAIDSVGNIFVGELNNYTIRKITPGGVVTTFAGTVGVIGSADGTGSAASFSSILGINIDSSDNLYVSDGSTIRKITPAAVVTTFAGSYGVYGYVDGTGSAASFGQPAGLALDSSNNLYVAEVNCVRKITPGRVVTTFAGNCATLGNTNGTGSAARFYMIKDITIDSAGNSYVADSYNNSIRKITPGGAVTTLAAITYPESLVIDGSGNLYVTSFYAVYKVTSVGVVTVLAGIEGTAGSADGSGGNATFYGPTGIRMDSSTNLLIADQQNNTIRKVTLAGVVTTFVGFANAGSNDGIGNAARLAAGGGLATDSLGNIFVADNQNSIIRKITPLGVMTTFAGLAGITGSTDGSGSSARFNQPSGIAADSSDNLFVTDSGNNTIRKITPSAVVTTFAGTAGLSGTTNGTGSAARFGQTWGPSIDSANNIYVADSMAIRKITAGAVVTTLAGISGTSGSADGTGSAARFYFPSSTGVDSSGNVYVVDSNNQTIRKITPAGVVTTLAGTAGNSGDNDGTGSAASFSYPFSLVVNSNIIYVTDRFNSKIKKISLAGVVKTIAGYGFDGLVFGPLPTSLGNCFGIAVFKNRIYVQVDNTVAWFPKPL